jgi:DNA-binding MarR family transcriptional regulator
MGDALRRRIIQSRFETPVHEAMLNLAVAANFAREATERAIAHSGITLPQYNVLRILRGIHPGGHPRGEIASRMLDRAPDVTRLIDRLEAKQLVEREREGEDRRKSITRITESGLALLAALDAHIETATRHLGHRLTERDAIELSRLCELIYDDGSSSESPER